MPSSIQNFSLPYSSKSPSHFQLACTGIEPVSELARRNLHPSSYTIPWAGRIVHLFCAIPLVGKVIELAANYFYPPVPERLDKEYRILPLDQVRLKLRKEEARIQASQKTQKPNPRFVKPTPSDMNRVACSTKYSKFRHGKTSIHCDLAYMRGRRPTMEDAHLAEQCSVEIKGKKYTVSLFGTFDGHGGSSAARFSKANMTSYVKKYLERHNSLSDDAIFNALKLAFVDLDRHYRGNAGSTACLIMFFNDAVWVANSGDSRAVWNKNGRAIQLSEDMKPNTPRFKKRIVDARLGTVLVKKKVPRINGGLAVGGAIGDHRYLGQGGLKCVPTRPKIRKVPFATIAAAGGVSDIVAACDGVWDVASSQQVCDPHGPQQAKEIAIAAYLAGSGDNISAMRLTVS